MSAGNSVEAMVDGCEVKVEPIRVSIAMCTYNGEKYVAQQLQSIAEQTRRPDEIIILDDRSTDATVEIVKDVCRKTGLEATVEVNKHQRGTEGNFSCALGRTHGDVVFFCDQDDVWMPNRVDRMLTPFSDSKDVMLVYSDGYITAANLEHRGMTLFDHGGGKKDLTGGSNRDVGRWLKQGRNPGIKASSMAFRSKVRELAWPLPEKVEHDAWIAYFGYALGRVVAIDEPLYYYRRHPETHGASSTNSEVGEESKDRSSSEYAERIRQRAHLAGCLKQRLRSFYEAEPNDGVAVERPPLVYDDVVKAARMLRRRAGVVGEATDGVRMLRGLFALLTGSYDAFDGFRERLRHCRRDCEAHVDCNSGGQTQ